jgi:hypothetical protein
VVHLLFQRKAGEKTMETTCNKFTKKISVFSWIRCKKTKNTAKPDNDLRNAVTIDELRESTHEHIRKLFSKI